MEQDLVFGLFTPTAIERLISGSFVLIGIFIGAGLTVWRERRNKKTENTYALHREFSTPDMLVKRIGAEKLLSKNRGTPFLTLYQTLRDEEIATIMTVVRFFERLHVYTKNGQIDPKTVSDLFGENFVYYQEQYLRDGFRGSSWKVGAQLEDLFGWFRKSTPKNVFDNWLALADQHRIDLDEHSKAATEKG